MHYLIAHRIKGRLVLAVNRKKKDFIGSQDFNEVLDYIQASPLKHPQYSPAILSFNNLYEIDNCVASKTIKTSDHFSGLIHYVEIKYNYAPKIVKYIEVESGRYGKLGYVLDQK